ncbi:hypothetical protein BIW11_11569 [Tropilaelaps mercedesae]|uniref:Tudor domain-containing protein n=1 Tax=Tropilaelaps mercedesae TaxID=418985 RepID=A0A1V9XB02_9ACAR|nr:hypothetical protein BIW11_11569 [Tropilaelaps mercedesae]
MNSGSSSAVSSIKMSSLLWQLKQSDLEIDLKALSSKAALTHQSVTVLVPLISAQREAGTYSIETYDELGGLVKVAIRALEEAIKAINTAIGSTKQSIVTHGSLLAIEGIPSTTALLHNTYSASIQSAYCSSSQPWSTATDDGETDVTVEISGDHHTQIAEQLGEDVYDGRISAVEDIGSKSDFVTKSVPLRDTPETLSINNSGNDSKTAGYRTSLMSLRLAKLLEAKSRNPNKPIDEFNLQLTQGAPSKCSVSSTNQVAPLSSPLNYKAAPFTPGNKITGPEQRSDDFSSFADLPGAVKDTMPVRSGNAEPAVQADTANPTLTVTTVNAEIDLTSKNHTAHHEVSDKAPLLHAAEFIPTSVQPLSVLSWPSLHESKQSVMEVFCEAREAMQKIATAVPECGSSHHMVNEDEKACHTNPKKNDCVGGDSISVDLQKLEIPPADALQKDILANRQSQVPKHGRNEQWAMVNKKDEANAEKLLSDDVGPTSTSSSGRQRLTSRVVEGRLPKTAFEMREPPMWRHVVAEVTHVDMKAGRLYVVLDEDNDLRQKIYYEILAARSSGKVPSDENLFQYNTIVIAPFEDEVFRALFVCNVTVDDCKVYFLDFGNTAIVPKKDIRLLPTGKATRAALKTGQLAIPCELAGRLNQPQVLDALSGMLKGFNQRVQVLLNGSRTDNEAQMAIYAIEDIIPCEQAINLMPLPISTLLQECRHSQVNLDNRRFKKKSWSKAKAIDMQKYLENTEFRLRFPERGSTNELFLINYATQKHLVKQLARLGFCSMKNSQR